MAYVINSGNTDDIRTSLKHMEDRLTIRQLRIDLDDEKNLPGHRRSTVIQMLVGAIKKKLKLSGTKSTPGVCKVCLCTQDHACPDPETGTCYWVLEDLCSACASPAQRQKAINEMKELMGNHRELVKTVKGSSQNEKAIESLKTFNTSFTKHFTVKQ